MQAQSRALQAPSPSVRASAAAAGVSKSMAGSPGASIAAAAPDDSGVAAAKLRSHTAELDAIFRCIDRDKDGRVSLSDFSSFFNETLQQNKAETDLLALLIEIAGVGAPRVVKDAKGAPLLSFPSFLAFIERQLSRPIREVLQPIFNHLDADQDGRITAVDLNNFSSLVGLRLGEDGASQLLRSGGSAGDSVDFDAFCSLVSKCLPS